MIRSSGTRSRGTRSSAERLRRLRLLLTLLFTLINAGGLVVFCWLAIRADGEQGRLRLDGELRRVTSTVTRLIQYDGSIVTAYVGSDDDKVTDSAKRTHGRVRTRKADPSRSPR